MSCLWICFVNAGLVHLVTCRPMALQNEAAVVIWTSHFVFVSNFVFVCNFVFCICLQFWIFVLVKWWPVGCAYPGCHIAASSTTASAKPYLYLLIILGLNINFKKTKKIVWSKYSDLIWAHHLEIPSAGQTLKPNNFDWSIINHQLRRNKLTPCDLKSGDQVHNYDHVVSP